MTEEARLEQSDSGLKPASDGWFVVNAGETGWAVHDAFGSGCTFESGEVPFRQLGINISVVEPGQPLCLYHEESAQEGFLVLAGECVLLVNGEERPLKAWDFFHCPAGTEHVIVGAGDALADRARGGRPARRADQLPEVGPSGALRRKRGRDHHRPAGGVHAGRAREAEAGASRLLGQAPLG